MKAFFGILLDIHIKIEIIFVVRYFECIELLWRYNVFTETNIFDFGLDFFFKFDFDVSLFFEICCSFVFALEFLTMDSIKRSRSRD